MLTLHLDIQSQVIQGDTQAKTWQRVWLSNRTTNRQNGKTKEEQGGNNSYQKDEFLFTTDSFAVNQKLALQMICGKSPALRVPTKRFKNKR